MTKIAPGLTATISQTVSDAMLANQVGSGSVAVFATPELILLLEKAAVAALKGHLPAGQTSVGAKLNVAHLAATPVGMTVSASAALIAVEGRKLTFEVFAADDVEPVAKGTHTRYIVDAAKFTARTKAKAKA